MERQPTLHGTTLVEPHSHSKTTKANKLQGTISFIFGLPFLCMNEIMNVTQSKHKKNNKYRVLTPSNQLIS